jgi:gamma-glutamyltranspeptidase/glutathione hydrolase
MTAAPTPGIVAAGHPAAADAAASMLRAGGNAFDATVAAGFASAVCEPGFTSLAGGGFLLARTEGADVLFDFFVDTPGRGRPDGAPMPVFDEVTVRFAAADQAFHCGPGSVAVPGVLAGYLHVHRRLGRLGLAEVVAPAAELARSGVEVSATQAQDFALLEPILARTEPSRAIFFPDGVLLGHGDVLVNPDLAGFLDTLGGDQARTFYEGPLAHTLVEQLHDHGGLLTLEDLAAYRVIERRPLRVRYRDKVVVTNPPPTFGGALLGVALRRLAARGATPQPGGPAWARTLAEVMAEVDRDRRDGHREILAALRGDFDDDPDARPLVSRGTTHVTVADGEGNVAAMTTSNGECSGDVIAGTGISCNNMLGEDDLHPDGFHAAPPGLRVASMMSPTFVLDRGGRVELALGSGGSKRIRSAILQVLASVVDHGTDLQTAVDAPRLHWDEDHLEVEPGFDEPVLEELARYAPLNRWPARSMYFGGVHAVAPGCGGAGDARRGGSVTVVER